MTEFLSDWECVSGGTFLAPSGPKNHLFILLIKLPDDAGYNPNSYIRVNITSIKDDALPYDDIPNTLWFSVKFPLSLRPGFVETPHNSSLFIVVSPSQETNKTKILNRKP